MELVGTNTVTQDTPGTAECSFCAEFHTHTLRTGLAQKSIRLGIATPVSPQLIHCIGSFFRSSNCKFQCRRACSLKSSALTRPWRCSLDYGITLSSPRSPHHVVFVRLHGHPAKLTMRPFSAPVGDERFCPRSVSWCRYGRGVGLTVHLRLSETPVVICFLEPECCEIEMLHPASSTSLHHAASCCSSCCLQLCFAIGEGGDTRFEPRLSQSDHDARAALAFRPFVLPKRFSANASRYATCVPAGYDCARCGLCTTDRTTRRAQTSVPHAA